MTNHNTVFSEYSLEYHEGIFHGVPLEQYGPAYFNIPHPATQGTHQTGTSQQGRKHAEDVDAQVGQNPITQSQGATAHSMQHQSAAPVQMQQPTGQNQMVNFGTTDYIPPSATKIDPSQQRIRRNTYPNIFNQILQEGVQSWNQNINVPQGFHYSTDYNTLNMIPNPGYQGTQSFSP